MLGFLFLALVRTGGGCDNNPDDDKNYPNGKRDRTADDAGRGLTVAGKPLRILLDLLFSRHAQANGNGSEDGAEEEQADNTTNHGRRGFADGHLGMVLRLELVAHGDLCLDRIVARHGDDGGGFMLLVESQDDE
jgi:hypothetical protein